jgi:hypothetical protein
MVAAMPSVKKWNSSEPGYDQSRGGSCVLDHSSRPRTSPARLPVRTERRIIALRFSKQWGPHRIGILEADAPPRTYPQRQSSLDRVAGSDHSRDQRVSSSS